MAAIKRSAKRQACLALFCLPLYLALQGFPPQSESSRRDLTPNFVKGFKFHVSHWRQAFAGNSNALMHDRISRPILPSFRGIAYAKKGLTRSGQKCSLVRFLPPQKMHLPRGLTTSGLVRVAEKESGERVLKFDAFPADGCVKLRNGEAIQPS